MERDPAFDKFMVDLERYAANMHRDLGNPNATMTISNHLFDQAIANALHTGYKHGWHDGYANAILKHGNDNNTPGDPPHE